MAARVAAGWLRSEAAIMGTSIVVELWSDSPRDGEAAIAAVMNEMHRIDATMSHYRADSELSRINREAAKHAVPLSGEMFLLIAQALRWSAISGGAFDISTWAAGSLYDFRQRVAPSAAELAQASEAIGWRHLELDSARRSLRFARPGVQIDLGGFAKGYAVDNAAAILRRFGIGHAMVSAGGDSRLLGDRRGRPWTIGIRDPRREGEMVALLPLEDCAVSTSGDYERFFEQDGTRFHHVIDPRTGQSARTVRSVTIVAPDGLTSEALSKSVFVLGVQQGLRLVDSQEGVDAVVVDCQGGLHYSAGLLAEGQCSRH
jgi:FAD:protein FMN transferase